MNSSQTELLQDFITQYNLKRPDGMIAFPAMVAFYKEGRLMQMLSEILVVQLPQETAVYILEFFKDEHSQPEMYSTSKYWFNRLGATLQIKEDAPNEHFIACISLLD